MRNALELEEPALEAEEFTDQERAELAQLRKRQMEGPWSKEDAARLLYLADLETKARGGLLPLSEEEREEYLRLTRKQSAGGEWTTEDADKLDPLQRRADAQNKKRW